MKELLLAESTMIYRPAAISLTKKKKRSFHGVKIFNKGLQKVKFCFFFFYNE